MGKTTISWTEKTWPVSRGCSRESEGCRHCYAERIANRFSGEGKPFHGYVTSRLKVVDNTQYTEAQWTGKVVPLPDELATPFSWRQPSMVFVNSMSDLFHPKLSNEYIAAVFGVMAATEHTYQVLTKRAERLPEWFEWIEREARTCNDGVGMSPAARCFVEAQRQYRHIPFNLYGRAIKHPMTKARSVERAMAAPWPLPNVWLGASVEDQKNADNRLPFLVAAPAAVRFLSCEPLLGPVNIEKWISDLHWLIAGCESGPRARECDIAWLRHLRDQCLFGDVRFFLKQARALGTMPVTSYDEHGNVTIVKPAENCDAHGEPCVHGIDRTCSDPPTAPHHKGMGVYERPYLDGKQHLAMPAR